MKIFSLSAVLFFSIANYLPAHAQTAADAHAMLSAASKQFRVLPKNFSIPVPPHIELKCGKLNEQQSKQINDYAADQFPEPEESILRKMLAARKIFEQLKDQPGAEAAMDSTGKILNRLLKKAIYGVNAYGGDKFYCIPISIAAIKVEKEANLLTSNSSNEILDLVIAKRAEVVQELLNDLKTKHDYSLFKTIMYYDKEAHIGRESSESSDEIFEKLRNALKFEVSLEMQVQLYIDDNGKKDLHISYDAKGKIPLSFDDNLQHVTGKAVLSASGSEKSSLYGNQIILCNNSLTSTKFPITVTSLYLDACDKYEVTLEGESYFGPDPEIWTDCGKGDGPGRNNDVTKLPNQNSEGTDLGNIVQQTLGEAGISSTVPMHFEDFKFIMPLYNNSKEAGRVEFIKLREDGWVVKLTLIVDHTPK